MWKRILMYLIGAVTIVSLVIGTQIVTAETGLIVKLPKPITNIASEIGQSFTLGMVGVAYATTPDYICDGVADDVEIQAAMNALPATGGELFFFGGNYVLTATVTRAINNISIVGSGYSTYFANDGGTAIFSNGAQTGWQFDNFRTDAGYLTLATACIIHSVWNNTYYIDSTVGAGATVPLNPRTGQQWLHTPTGRNILVAYNGTSWKPVTALGNITIYVDGTDGTDNINYGAATGVNAVKTIEFALSLIPRNSFEYANVILSDDTFTITDDPLITSFNPSNWSGHGDGLLIEGALTLLDSGIATGGTIGSGNITISVSGAFVAHANEGKLLKFTSGANDGYERIISYTTVGTMYLCGDPLPAAPINGDTYEIYDWATTIDGMTEIVGSNNILFEHVNFTNTSGGANTIAAWGQAYVRLDGCQITVSAGTSGGVAATGSLFALYNCNVYLSVAAARNGLRSEDLGQLEVRGCRIAGNAKQAGSIGIQAWGGHVLAVTSTEILDWDFGIRCQQNGFVTMNVSSFVYDYIHGNKYGVDVIEHGYYKGKAKVIYGLELDALTADINTSANDQADAPSFAYVQPY